SKTKGPMVGAAGRPPCADGGDVVVDVFDRALDARRAWIIARPTQLVSQWGRRSAPPAGFASVRESENTPCTGSPTVRTDRRTGSIPTMARSTGPHACQQPA